MIYNLLCIPGFQELPQEEGPYKDKAVVSVVLPVLSLPKPQFFGMIRRACRRNEMPGFVIDQPSQIVSPSAHLSTVNLFKIYFRQT